MFYEKYCRKKRPQASERRDPRLEAIFVAPLTGAEGSRGGFMRIRRNDNVSCRSALGGRIIPTSRRFVNKSPKQTKCYN